MTTIAEKVALATQRQFREIAGVVISAGKMRKTVKVRIGGTTWNSFVKKPFKKPVEHMVHDPRDSLRLGDVVAITPGWRVSKSVRHVVKRIIAPAQVPVDERPPVPTTEERWTDKITAKAAKDERKRTRDQVSHVERTLEKTAQLAGHAKWEIDRIKKIMAVRNPNAGFSDRTDAAEVRAEEMLKRIHRLVRTVERAIEQSPADSRGQ